MAHGRRERHAVARAPAERAARRPLRRLRRTEPSSAAWRAGAAHLGVGIGERAVEAELCRSRAAPPNSMPLRARSRRCSGAARTLAPMVTLVIAFSTLLSNAVSANLTPRPAASRSPPRSLRAARCSSAALAWVVTGNTTNGRYSSLSVGRREPAIGRGAQPQAFGRLEHRAAAIGERPSPSGRGRRCSIEDRRPPRIDRAEIAVLDGPAVGAHAAGQRRPGRAPSRPRGTGRSRC